MNKVLEELNDIIDEADKILDEARRKKVIRKGKIKKKLFCPKGQKAKGGRCVTMKSTEKGKRKRMAKKSAVKRKAKSARMNKKRAKSMRKRKSMGM